MKKILSHENRMIVYNLKNVLQGEGIKTQVMNEFSAGGAGDLATFDTWPELWIENEGQTGEAEKIIEEILHGDEAGYWFCNGCQEKNDASFKLCWKCGQSYE